MTSYISEYLFNAFTDIHELYHSQPTTIIKSEHLNLELPEWKTKLNERDELMKDPTYVPKKIQRHISSIGDTFHYIHFNVFSEMPFSYYIYTPSTSSISNSKMKYYSKLISFLSHFIYEMMVRKMGDCVNKIEFRSVHVHIYMTGYKKILPIKKIKLNADYVNTGLTEGYSETGNLIIFRKEEWYKTLIHELLHLFGADQYTLSNRKNKNTLLDIFNVHSQMRYGEAFVEFWANVLQSAFLSYYQNMDDYHMFNIHFETYLHLELQFSLYQANKILDYMVISYEDLYKGVHSNNKYKKQSNKTSFQEETNVFCYYILKTILLYNSNDFFIWCIQNNHNIFKLKKEDSMYTFIQMYYNHPSFVKTMNMYMNVHRQHQGKGLYALHVKDIKKTFKKNTLRMTILDLPNEHLEDVL